MVLQLMRSGARGRVRAALVVLALALYALMWAGWELGWSWVVGPDDLALAAAGRAAVEHRGWVIFWDVWCTVFSPLSFRLLALGLIVVALLRRSDSSPARWAPAGPRRVALFLFLSVELSGLVTEIAKWLADRPRPATAMVHALGTSFPSGHALGSMVAMLAFAVVLGPLVRGRLRPPAIVAAVLVVVMVGVGRVALNVHHSSDVLAGWALGYLYFVACLPVLGHRDAVTATD
jgi:undecaprenyl-diphosphatase